MPEPSGRGLARAWQAMDSEDVFSALESVPEGLTEDQAEERLARYGPNRLRPARKRSLWALFLHQLNNVLIYVLLGSAGITLAIGHWIDAGIILGVVLINAVIGLVQEGKAEKALEAVRDLLSPAATVLRDGRQRTVPSEELVPGDVVLVQAGDRIPADLRIIQTSNLRIDESSLTGESVPVEKGAQSVGLKAPIGDRSSMGFSGTLATQGQGRAVVAETGDRTEIGKISALIALAPPMTTRLLLKMAAFGRRLTLAIGILSLATFAFGVWIRSYGVIDMFLAVVGLAVAAIPEGLPAILTITLAIGVQRMARRNAIIRRLPSVETLGSVTVICSDKTGTLTRNEMTVRSVETASSSFEVGGAGYEPVGAFSKADGRTVCPALGGGIDCSAEPDLLELAQASLLCNDASVHQDEGRWQVVGDPTEGALVVFAVKAGLDPAGTHQKHPRLDVIPFDAEHRFMATLHNDGEGRKHICLKGAPEDVLSMCRFQRRNGRDEPLEEDRWIERIQRIAMQGKRSLAVAVTDLEAHQGSLAAEDVRQGMSLLGVVGMIDPPRGSAVTAIQQCRSAGIRVKMITGDHMLTARAVGAEMGIGDGVSAVTGQELDGMSDEALLPVVRGVDVFARVSPEHKLRLVRALQADGEVVAMTGDGVNDAPALKQADIGVAMGINGTEVAKEAAEMVLADDNFASIEHAVEEGRTVYENIKKAILFILPTSMGEAGIIIAAILFGRVLPITPVQILWINMVTAVTLALSLSFEPPEAGAMKRPPRPPGEPLMTPLLIWRIGFVTLILAIGTFALFAWERDHGMPIETARTVAVNTLVAFEIFYLFATRYLLDTCFSREGLLGNSYVLAGIGAVIAFQMLFTYFGPMQELFGSATIGMSAWGGIIAVSCSVLLLVELEKALLRRAGKRRSG